MPENLSATPKQVHCLGLIARNIGDKDADMDDHTVRPPECRTGGEAN